MAENNKESIKNVEATKDDLPSSEDIVDSLVKEFKGDAVKIDDTTEKVVEAGLTNNSSPLNSGENDKANTSSELLNSENDEDDSETKESEPAVEDDFIDEDHLKDLEVDYSEDQKLKLKSEAEELKNDGNNNFKAGEFREAAHSYTKALRICPLAFDKDRAIMYANRAAAKVKLSLNETAIEDCTKAVELDPQYLKAFLRRAQLYEKTDKLDEALADYNKILEIDPLHRDALFASKRLPEQINERNEKLKTEMMGKLKDLGNMFLKPFGLSTNNFQMVQDPNSGGYSINFNSNTNQS